MTTGILPTDSPAAFEKAVESAVELLRAGEPVALPTETVYGLAADALNPKAVARIFEAKSRPLEDPLIVHLPSREWIGRIAKVEAGSRKVVDSLMEKFWPGPLTFILSRQDLVPDLVTAGQDTVAVRMSAHPVFSAVCGAFGNPLAAPSANRFGKISPTTASHVLSELDGRIPLIVDGGPCLKGIESTIARVNGMEIVILRHGPITEEQLGDFGKVVSRKESLAVPGNFKSHYAPQCPLVLLEKDAGPSIPASRCGLLAWRGTGEGYKKTVKLSEQLDLSAAAANLYAAMRELDESGVDLIVAEPVPVTGIGKAIMERLRKAAAARE